MGATIFRTSSRGTSVKEAYENAIEEAIFENGNDPYNGTISTTHGFRDVTKEYKDSKLSLSNFIENMYQRLSKRDCVAICVDEPKENKNKVKSKVDHIVTPGTKKWVLKYVVRKYNYDVLSTHVTKGDAVKAARTYTEKTKSETTIHMCKVLEKQSDKVAKVSYKKSTSEKDGRWIFIGWAAD
jgi:hypothetical protein